MDDIYLDRVLTGDTEAFRYFVRTYKDLAFNVAVSIVKDDHYAEEVIQDAFMKAFNGIKSFNRTAMFKTWFYRIVVNESFQRLKKIKRNPSLSDIDEVKDSLGECVLDETNEKMQAIKRALRLLPSNENLALNLFYLEENSLNEIGDITGWTMANTKVILHRARKNLRTLLGSTFKLKN